MATSKRTTSKKTPPEMILVASTPLADTASLKDIYGHIKVEGFVPAAMLREKFGDTAVTQAIAILYRDLRLLREVRRPYTFEDGTREVLGYEWQNKRIPQAQAKKLPDWLGFLVEMTNVGTSGPRYGEYQGVTIHCRWTAPVLGGKPMKDEQDDDYNGFERDAAGNILILRYNQRAMLRDGLKMLGREMSASRHIFWSTIRIPSTVPVKLVKHGIVAENGSGGLGLRVSEMLPDGTPFTMRGQFPTTYLGLADLLRIVIACGQFVGLSPGRSAGFGDFEVLGTE